MLKTVHCPACGELLQVGSIHNCPCVTIPEESPAAATPQKEPTAPETVNHPSHYNAGNIEVIDAIEDWRLGFHLGNVVKYIARAEHKGKPIEDLKKARWYLDRYIDHLEMQTK